MPVAVIIQAILAALAAAPQFTDLFIKAKDFFAGMFAAGLITKEQQDALFARVDADLKLFSTGMVPTWWTVEPDPVTSKPPTAPAPTPHP